MGDRYQMYGLRCAYCDFPQEEVYLAESSGFFDHKCESCGMINDIIHAHQLGQMTVEEHAMKISDFSGEPYEEVLKDLDRTKYGG